MSVDDLILYLAITLVLCTSIYRLVADYLIQRKQSESDRKIISEETEAFNLGRDEREHSSGRLQ